MVQAAANQSRLAIEFFNELRSKWLEADFRAKPEQVQPTVPASKIGWPYLEASHIIGVGEDYHEGLIDITARREIENLQRRLVDMNEIVQRQTKQIESLMAARSYTEELRPLATAYHNVSGHLEPFTGEFVAITFDGKIIGHDRSELNLLNQLVRKKVPPERYFIYEVGSKILGSEY